MPSRSQRMRATAAALALLVGCGRGEPAGRHALEFVQGDGLTFYFDRLPTGQYLAHGTSTGAVHEQVRVLGVQPEEMSGAVTFVGAKIAFFACQPQCRDRPGYWGSKWQVSAFCGASPPASRVFYPAEGMTLYPGDAPMFVLVYRTTSQSEASVRGLRVRYRVGNKTRTVRSPVNSAVLRTDEAPLANQCMDSVSRAWSGGSGEEAFVVEL